MLDKGIMMHGFGIDNHAIHIENYGLYHISFADFKMWRITVSAA